MAIVVSILGVIAIAIGLAGLAQPRRLVAIVEHWDGATRFWLAVVVRLVFGAALLVVAPNCRLPIVAQVLGIIAIVAAVVILIVGQRRLDSFIAWWLTGSSVAIRVAALFALAVGILLVYAGA